MTADLDPERLAVLSTGERTGTPKKFHAYLERLCRLRQLRGRGCAGRTERRIARAQTRTTDSFRGHLHEVTTRFVREHPSFTVVSRDIHVVLDSPPASAAGACSAVLVDFAWPEVVRQLDYKSLRAGRVL